MTLAWRAPLPGRTRQMGWVQDERLKCPRGHRIAKNAVVFTDGLLRCRHQDAPKAPLCGAMFYAVATADFRGRAATAYFLVEVTGEEWTRLEALAPCRSVAEILELLGATIEAAA